MKHSLRIAIKALGALCITALFYCILSSPSRFEHFCDTFFQEELSTNSLTLHYTVREPENYGIPAEQISLGSYDTDLSAQKRNLLYKSFALRTIIRGMLEKEAQITYDLVKYCLKTELERLDFYLLEEPLVPSIGIQSQLPILLAEYAFYEEADVINYLTLLSCVPEYFDSLLALEEERCARGLFTDSESVEELITYCEQILSQKDTHFLVETFAERLEPLALSSEKQTLYIEENLAKLTTCVFPSYERLKDFLIAHKNDAVNENGLYYLEGGTDYYAWLLRSEIGIDRSFEEIEAMLESALKQEASNIAALLQENPNLPEAQHTISLDTSNPAGLTAYLSKRAAHDFPDIPEVSVEISNVPSSLEPHLSPAFYLVPPLDDSQHNVVYLNNGALKEGVSFFTTLAHESYPGHLYQTAYENASDSHPIHRLLYFGGYIEGWATYAEQFSYQYLPVSKDLAALLSSSRAMTLNIYANLDLSIHAYGWTEEDCKTYLKKFGITGAESVHEIFQLVKQQPANYLKYYLGYLEICELRKNAEEKLGEKFNLKEFHEFLLEYGPAPFPLLEKYLEEWLHSSQNHKPHHRYQQTRQHIQRFTILNS